MDKKNLSLMMFWETLDHRCGQPGGRTSSRLALGKLLFLIFLKIIHFPVPLDFAVEPEALLQTVRLFLAVFLINLLWNLFRVARTGITELVGASRAGKRNRGANGSWRSWGLRRLSAVHYIAQTADSPLKAVNVFFLAVILVVIGTYPAFL